MKAKWKHGLALAFLLVGGVPATQQLRSWIFLTGLDNYGVEPATLGTNWTLNPLVFGTHRIVVTDALHTSLILRAKIMEKRENAEVR